MHKSTSVTFLRSRLCFLAALSLTAAVCLGVGLGIGIASSHVGAGQP